MGYTAELTVEKHFDPVGARMGMWLFLFTELLLFGGLFLLYAIYLNKHPQDFHYGSSHLDQFVGALNTVILLTSSLTMVLSVASLQRYNRKLAIIFLILTFLLGGVFLVNKYFEWGSKISHGLYPGSSELLQHPHGEILFYGLYYTMTGLHGLHVLIGMVIMLFLLYFVTKKSHRALTVSPNVLETLTGKKLSLSVGKDKKLWESEEISGEVKEIDVVVKGIVTRENMESNMVKFENAGLYWHLVDIIWIFLFPLFYLIAM
jgi:cytochrome c oxidase subunit 3